MSLVTPATVEELHALCPWIDSTYYVHMDCGRLSLKESDRAKLVASGVEPGELRRCSLPHTNPQIMHYSGLPAYPARSIR